MRLLDQFMGGL